MADGQLSRRAVLTLAAAGAGTSLVNALGPSGSGDLFGGTMALTEAYKLAESDRAIFIGPDSAKSGVAATTGDYYIASDTGDDFHFDGGGWVKQPDQGALTDSGTDNANGGDQYHLPQSKDGIDLRDGALDAQSISNIADEIVGDASELVSAFNNISAGDTIYVGQPATPMTISQWLDIDVSDVTVKFESSFAADGNPVVQVASGANVGGIRIGHNNAINNITIDGYGHDGNYSNQDASVKNLTGIGLSQVTNCVVRNCFVTRTSPYHEHGSGGSGITATEASDLVWITNNWVDDPGDRCIQSAAQRTLIFNNRCTNGYDRGISLSVSHGLTGGSYGHFVGVIGNIIDNMSDGSSIGINGDSTQDTTAVIANNIAKGGQKSMLKVFDATKVLLVANNISNMSTAANSQSGIVMEESTDANDVDYISIVGNMLANHDGKGINFLIAADGIQIANNYILNCTGTGIHSGGFQISESAITGNYINNPGIHGIEVNKIVDSLISSNYIFKAEQTGIRLADGTEARNQIIANQMRECQHQNSGGADSNFIIQHAGTDNYFVGNQIDVQYSNVAVYENSGAVGYYYHNNVTGDGGWNLQDGSILNGEVVESASAETPQGSYPTGTLVRFTDSGDGSGTGTYLVARDGSTIQLASSV